MKARENNVLRNKNIPQDFDAQNTTEAEMYESERNTIPENDEYINNDAVLQNQENIAENTIDNGERDRTFAVKFNHKIKYLTQEEAREYAQKGMQAEGIMNDLRYLAARVGESSVSVLVKKLIETSEASRRAELSERVNGEDESLLETLMSADIENYKKTAGIMQEDEQKSYEETENNENRRLATEFMDLQREFPEIRSFNDIPTEVIKMAAENKTSLLDSYLRFEHSENKKIKDAEAAQWAAENASAGSGSTRKVYGSNSAVEAMRRGVGN